MIARLYLYIFFAFATLAIANAPVNNRAAAPQGNKVVPPVQQPRPPINRPYIPRPNGGSNGKIPTVRLVKDEGDNDPEDFFSLGTARLNEEHEQQLFEKFTERSTPFFSAMYDIFAAKQNYVKTQNPYAKATGKENPFKNYNQRPSGKPMTITRTLSNKREIFTVFDPTKPRHVCNVWQNLANFCENGGTNCACWSGSHYVPDQWNSLAAGCAEISTECSSQTAPLEKQWCSLGKTAAANTDLCVTESSLLGTTVSSVKFAEKANIASTPQSQTDPKTTSTSRTKSGTNVPIIETTTGVGGDSGPIETASTSTTLPSRVRTSSSPTATTVRGSWSPRLLDPVSASFYSFVVVAIAFLQ